MTDENKTGKQEITQTTHIQADGSVRTVKTTKVDGVETERVELLGTLKDGTGKEQLEEVSRAMRAAFSGPAPTVETVTTEVLPFPVRYLRLLFFQGIALGAALLTLTHVLLRYYVGLEAYIASLRNGWVPFSTLLLFLVPSCLFIGFATYLQWKRIRALEQKFGK